MSRSCPLIFGCYGECGVQIYFRSRIGRPEATRPPERSEDAHGNEALRDRRIGRSMLRKEYVFRLAQKRAAGRFAREEDLRGQYRLVPVHL